MSNLTKTVNKTTVNGSELFVYTLNAAYSGLSGPATNGKVTDFFPSKIIFSLPPIGSGIQSITQTSQSGGTLVTFNFGPVTNGTSISFNVSCSFGQGRVNNDTFTNAATQYADAIEVGTATAPTVNLTLDDNFTLSKLVLSSAPINPGSTIEYILQLANPNDPGFTLNNIVITDVLPSILTPDLTFTPVGMDVPYSGFRDPTYNGRTGSFTGNTLNFTLPSYSGGIYQIKFRAIVSPTAIPGAAINNTATWTANSVERIPANSLLYVFQPTAKMSLTKNAPLYATLGGNIQYTLNSVNTGNVVLTNFVLQDDLPPQVDVKTVYFYSVIGEIPSYSIEIATSDAPAVFNTILANATGPSPVIDLTPSIPAGARVVSVRVKAPTITTQNLGHYLALNGTINNTATLDQIITNNGKSSASSTLGNILYSTTGNTVLNAKSTLEIRKLISPVKASYSPLDALDMQLVVGTSKGSVTDPVITDLLPAGIDVSAVGYYIEFFNILGNKKYDSRNPDFPIPMPTYTVTKNYNNTGRTLVRWEFTNYTLQFRNSITIHFGTIITINPPVSFSNVGYLGNPGDNTDIISTPFLDAPDYDNDGITDENIAQSNEVTGAILSTSEFILQKFVQGNKDATMSQAGNGTPGSDATYTLYVTNNQDVDLTNIEVVDILPYIGDTGVMLNTTPRGSQYNVYASSVVTAKIVNVLGEPVEPNPLIVVEYSTSTNPVRFDQNGDPIGTGTWSTTPPADITTLKSIRVTTDPSVILKPYERLEITLKVTIPVGSTPTLKAYNSFAVRADQVSGGTTEPLLPTEPNKVSLTVVAATAASIGNFVFEDLNHNGILDAGEPGVNGVTVQLYDEAGTTLLATTVTANNNLNVPGYYSFNGLAAGNYKVKFTPYGVYELTIQNLTTNGSKPDPTTLFTNVIPLAENQNLTTVYAGVFNNETPIGSIGNLVFRDLNSNGIYDTGEPGVNGVTVELYDAAGTALLDTQVTATNAGQDGYYNFTGLAAGEYKVKFIPQVGSNLTIQNLTTNGSKPDSISGFTNTITLGANEQITTIYAGILPVILMGSIGNIVFRDLNSNGIYDTGEPGVNGVTVELYDAAGTALLDTQVTATNVGQDGYYNFTGLAAGEYKVKFIPQVGSNLTIQNLTTNGSKPDPISGFTNTITLGANEQITTIYAGIVPVVLMGSIGNIVFRDLNSNGIYDIGEPGVNGVTVQLYDAAGTALLGTQVTSTNAGQDGYYKFVGLFAGEYKVKFIPQVGSNLTVQNLTTNGSKPDPTTLFTNTITLGANEQITTIYAGIVPVAPTGSIGNLVFRDLNSNGIYDTGEPGVNGVTVELYDAAGTTLLGTQVTTTNAGQDGYYNFTGLAAGEYKVKFVPQVGSNLTIQNLTTNGSKPDPTTLFTNTITLGANEQITTIYAGIVPVAPTGSIGNLVFKDNNTNGIYDSGDIGVNGVTVELYDANGTTLLGTQVTTTNAGQDGYYNFTGLAAGNYTLKFIPLTGTTLTVQNLTTNGSKPNPNTGFTNVITLSTNQIITDIYAGILEPCAPPVITTTIYCASFESVYNPLLGVTATDCRGNDITSSITVTQNTVNTGVVGSYLVTYSVTDSRNQTTTKTVTIKVCKNNIMYQAITDLIQSVALQETGMAHIINAEGEKIQKAMLISQDSAQILEVNSSATCMLNTLSNLEIILMQKLDIFKDVLNSKGCCENNN